MANQFKPVMAMVFVALASWGTLAMALPKGSDGFTADEREALVAQTGQALAKAMGKPVKVVETNIELYDARGQYVQVQARLTDPRGKRVDWAHTSCELSIGKDSPFAFVLFKRQNKAWVAKGTELCAVENPDWRDIDFQK